MIDAIVAIGLLMIVLAPLLILLANTNSSSGSARDRVAAYSVASSYVDLLQSIQAPVPPSPPVVAKAGPTRIVPTTQPTAFVAAPYRPYLSVVTVKSGVTVKTPRTGKTRKTFASAWPVHPAQSGASSWSTKTVGGIPYHLQAAGGWCVQTSGGTWTTGTLPKFTGPGMTQPVGYWVAVKVSWGVGAHTGGGTVVQYAQLTSTTTWPYTASNYVKTPSTTKKSSWSDPTECPMVLP